MIVSYFRKMVLKWDLSKSLIKMKFSYVRKMVLMLDVLKSLNSIIISYFSNLAIKHLLYFIFHFWFVSMTILFSFFFHKTVLYIKLRIQLFISQVYLMAVSHIITQFSNCEVGKKWPILLQIYTEKSFNIVQVFMKT